MYVHEIHSVQSLEEDHCFGVQDLFWDEWPHALNQPFYPMLEDDVFTGYLFYSNDKNSPVGYAQAIKRKIPNNFWNKFSLGKNKAEYEVIFLVPSYRPMSALFQPSYRKQGWQHLERIIQQYKDDPTVGRVHWWMDDNSLISPSLTTDTQIKEVQGSLFVLNTWRDYPHYIQSLTEEMSTLVQDLWKQFLTKHSVETQEYPKLEDLPPFKVNNEMLIEQLEQVDFMKSTPFKVLSLETSDDIWGVMLFYKGDKGNIFVDLLGAWDNDHLFDPIISSQSLIMTFLENKNWKKLRLSLNPVSFNDFFTRTTTAKLEKLGFCPQHIFHHKWETGSKRKAIHDSKLSRVPHTH